jgi:hypothetical protein
MYPVVEKRLRFFINRIFMVLFVTTEMLDEDSLSLSSYKCSAPRKPWLALPLDGYLLGL